MPVPIVGHLYRWIDEPEFSEDFSPSAVFAKTKKARKAEKDKRNNDIGRALMIRHCNNICRAPFLMLETYIESDQFVFEIPLHIVMSADGVRTKLPVPTFKYWAIDAFPEE